MQPKNIFGRVLKVFGGEKRDPTIPSNIRNVYKNFHLIFVAEFYKQAKESKAREVKKRERKKIYAFLAFFVFFCCHHQKRK